MAIGENKVLKICFEVQWSYLRKRNRSSCHLELQKYIFCFLQSKCYNTGDKKKICTCIYQIEALKSLCCSPRCLFNRGHSLSLQTTIDFMTKISFFFDFVQLNISLFKSFSLSFLVFAHNTKDGKKKSFMGNNSFVIHFYLIRGWYRVIFVQCVLPILFHMQL